MQTSQNVSLNIKKGLAKILTISWTGYNNIVCITKLPGFKALSSFFNTVSRVNAVISFLDTDKLKQD